MQLFKKLHIQIWVSVLFLVSFSNLSSVFAQDVLVNEYCDNTLQKNEWTEILVVKDNLNLAGWFLGDNNGSTNSWQPKVEFTNHPLWNNLRSGTYIIIDHAMNNTECNDTYDYDKSDGFIRVCVRNTTYFDGGTTSTLSLNDNGDFIHLVDPSGKHVHGLGHDANPGTSVKGGNCFTSNAGWKKTNGPQGATRPCGQFLFYQFDMTTATGDFNALYSKAGTLPDFNKMIQTAEPNDLIGVSTTPFEGIGNGGVNNLFIQELRKPKILAQSICLQVTGNNKKLVWQPAEDPNPSDGSIGYLVIRNKNGDFPLPQNGVAHKVGDVIGTGAQTAEVIAVLTSSQTTTYTDATPGDFSYRIFPFRYVNTPGFTHFTRGRTYNQTEFVKVNSQTLPEAVAVNDTLCQPGLATLKIKNTAGFALQWYDAATGGNAIAGATKDSLVVSVTENKSYFVELSNAASCQSGRFEVMAFLQPIVNPSIAFNVIGSYCKGFPLSISTQNNADWTYSWSVYNPVQFDSTGKNLNRISVTIPDSMPLEKTGKTNYLKVKLRAQNAIGCQSEEVQDSIALVNFDFEVKAFPDTIFKGDSSKIQLKAFGFNSNNSFISIDWNAPGIFTRYQDSATSFVKPLVNTSYKLTLTQNVFESTCKNSKRVMVYVKERKKDTIIIDTIIVDTIVKEPVLIPNLILSNSAKDLNTKLVIKGYTIQKIAIFNRFGKEVFSQAPYKNDWTGSDLVPGSYFFVADATRKDNGKKERIKNWLEIQ